MKRLWLKLLCRVRGHRLVFMGQWGRITIHLCSRCGREFSGLRWPDGVVRCQIPTPPTICAPILKEIEANADPMVAEMRKTMRQQMRSHLHQETI